MIKKFLEHWEVICLVILFGVWAVERLRQEMKPQRKKSYLKYCERI